MTYESITWQQPFYVLSHSNPHYSHFDSRFEVQKVRQAGLTISTVHLFDNITTIPRVDSERITSCLTAVWQKNYLFKSRVQCQNLFVLILMQQHLKSTVFTNSISVLIYAKWVKKTKKHLTSLSTRWS